MNRDVRVQILSRHYYLVGAEREDKREMAHEEKKTRSKRAASQPFTVDNSYTSCTVFIVDNLPIVLELSECINQMRLFL